MKKYTKRKGRKGRRGLMHQKQTRSKKYLKTRRQRCRYGGVSRRPSATPSVKPSLGIRQSSRTRAPPPPPPPPPPSKAPTRSASAKPTPGIVVFRDSVPVSQSHGRTPSRASSHPPKTSLRNAGILKKQTSKDDTEALEAAKLIAKFPQKMNKFLKKVIDNYELLNYEGVKYALRQKISINTAPAVGRLSTNGIIFISYICGKLFCLLNELITLPKSDVSKKNSLLYKIKQIEKVICLLDDVGCAWGIRPFNQIEMDTISDYYRVVKDDEAGLQNYYKELNKFIDKYFPVLKKYTDPSHVVSSSMCRRLIPGHVMQNLPTNDEIEVD